MSLLAYCIVEASAPVNISRSGVGNMPVESVESQGLRMFISRAGESVATTPGRDGALMFHGVIEEAFRQVAIVPFRFPTILPDESGASAYLSDHSAEYREVFNRLRSMVQMEIRLQYKEPPASPQTLSPPETRIKPSGTEYLSRIQSELTRLEAAANQLQRACGTLAQDWRQKASRRSMTCFVLIERVGIRDFQIQLEDIAVPPELAVRLTGPWPATEFLKNAYAESRESR